MSELGAAASSSAAFRPQLRIVSRPQPHQDESPLHSTDELLQLAESAHEEVAAWAAKTLLRLDPASAAPLLERLAGTAPTSTVETLLLTVLGERAPLPPACLDALLARRDPTIRDLTLLASLLSGPPLPITSFEESDAGRTALWLSDVALGGATRLEPLADTNTSDLVDMVLLDAAHEWLQPLAADRVMQIFLQAAKLPTAAPGALIVSHLAARLGVPEAADYLCGVMDLSIPSGLAQNMFPPIRRASPWAFKDDEIVELARELASARPSAVPPLASRALARTRGLRRTLLETAPAWQRALAGLTARTFEAAELVMVDLSAPARLGPYANVAGPLVAAALLAAARDSAWIDGFADDDRMFVRALSRARVAAAAPEEVVERAGHLEASRLIDIVAEETRRADPASLSLPLSVVETWGEEAWTDATLKLLLLNGQSFELSQRLFDALRPLSWTSVPKVARAVRLLPAPARSAALEYLADFPCRVTVEALLGAFPHYARSEWPGEYWNALAETGSLEAADKLAREWRAGEVTIARALSFVASIHPELEQRRRAILDDLRDCEEDLAGDRPPLLLPLHCSACGRTSEQVIDQLILAGESPDEASPTRILLCKYCGGVETWRHTRESLQRFDDALALELDEISRRGGTIPPAEARFLDIRRLGSVSGVFPPTPRAEWREAQDTLKQDPDHADALLTVGKLQRRGGWTRQATGPLSRLIQVHPDAVEGRIEYAFVRLERGRLDEAAEQYEKAAAMFCCTSLTGAERERLAKAIDELAAGLAKAGRQVPQLKREAGTGAPDLSASASFGGYEPSNGESFEETAMRLEREFDREQRPCPCASGKLYSNCCGTVVWQPFVS